MRKILSFLLVFAISISALHAANPQTVYTVRDEEYTRVMELCIRAGVNTPMPVSPVPAQVLIDAMERISLSSLSAADQKEYKEVMSILKGENTEVFHDDYLTFDIGADINIGATIAREEDFIFSNENKAHTPDYDRREDTIVPFRYVTPLLGLWANVDFGQNISLDVTFDLKNPPDKLYNFTFGSLVEGGSVTGEWPYQAGGSFGSEHFNLILGRYPHSMGSGITGNLLIGDNFNYQEVLSLLMMSSHFTYNISITRFDQEVFAGKEDNLTDFSRNEFRGPQQFRVTHRFDLRFTDQVRLAVNLTTLYDSNNGFDFRYLFPFVIGHNYYNYENNLSYSPHDEANNMLSLELEWNMTKGLLFTTQFVMDQFQMPQEDNSALPSAWGIMTNLRYSTTLAGGALTTWAEAVYTNPYLYLNGKYENGKLTQNSHNLDYITGYHAQYLDDYNYAGYIYGPDSIVCAAGAEYRSRDNRYAISAELMYRIKGLKELKHSSWGTNGSVIDTPEIENDPGEFMSNRITPSGGMDNAEHLIALSLGFEWNFNQHAWGQISAYGGAVIYTYINYKHSGENICKPQFQFGLIWSV